jgi:hypothetical protein
MEDAGTHWNQFNDHTIKDRGGNLHFRSVKDIDPANYKELNETRGEWECDCGKKFDRLGDMFMHINGTHYMVKEMQEDLSLSHMAEEHKAEFRERKARGEKFEPDPDFYYECLCGAVFFSLGEGILHMDDNPSDDQSVMVHSVVPKHYGHKYVCSCGQEFATELTAEAHLADNARHKISRMQGDNP